MDMYNANENNILQLNKLLNSFESYAILHIVHGDLSNEEYSLFKNTIRAEIKKLKAGAIFLSTEIDWILGEQFIIIPNIYLDTAWELCDKFGLMDLIYKEDNTCRYINLEQDSDLEIELVEKPIEQIINLFKIWFKGAFNLYKIILPSPSTFQTEYRFEKLI